MLQDRPLSSPAGIALTSSSMVGSLAGSGMRFRRQGGVGGGLTFTLPAELCCWPGARAGSLSMSDLASSKPRKVGAAAHAALLLPAPPLPRAAALRWFFRCTKWALPGWAWQWSSGCQPSPHSSHSAAGQSHT